MGYLLPILVIVFFGSHAHAGALVCAKDMNNNGSVGESGEMATCSPGGLCPIQAVDCTSSAPTYIKILTGTGRSRNNCDCTRVDGSPLCSSAPSATKIEVLPMAQDTTHTYIGFSAENFRDRGTKWWNKNMCSYDKFSYYVRVLQVCPFGSQYACLPNTGKFQCSPRPCADLTANPPTTETPDLTSHTNDGTVSAGGTCSGDILLFNGKPKECRHSSGSTNFFSCCNASQPNLENCSTAENELIQLKTAGVCHQIGTFCKKRSKLLGCMQTAETFCCFGSKLSRLTHEQGRGQLKSFTTKGIWGTPTAPECAGFTVSDFEALNFSKIDLSEYVAGKDFNNQENIKRMFTDEINRSVQ